VTGGEGEGMPSLQSLFTQEEKAYIDLVAATNDVTTAGLRMKVVTNMVFYIPSIVIGVYGLFSADFKVLGIGFLTLLASYAWGVFGEIRGWYYDRLGHSVFCKIRSVIT
jgi:hypothetical protein